MINNETIKMSCWVCDQSAWRLFKVNNIGSALKPDSFAITDSHLGSLFARIMKLSWWHYRVAHIGYFNRHNLDYLLTKVGYQPLVITTAKWYFSLDYLWERVFKYLPKGLRLKAPHFSQQITIPLDLHDSILAIYQK